MWRLLQYIFIGHVHKWTIIQKNKLYRDIDTHQETLQKLPTGDQYIIRCETCGKMKAYKF